MGSHSERTCSASRRARLSVLFVLVTDGWDNASSRFRAPASEPLTPEMSRRIDLVPHVLPNSSQLTLRIIGIGSGSERDKGVDSGQMNGLVEQLRGRAQAAGIASEVTYQEVATSTDLFSQMVNSFIDVDYEGTRPFEELHPEELAEHAARAAKALKAPGEHATLTQLKNRKDLPPPSSDPGPARYPPKSTSWNFRVAPCRRISRNGTAPWAKWSRHSSRATTRPR